MGICVLCFIVQHCLGSCWITTSRSLYLKKKLQKTQNEWKGDSSAEYFMVGEIELRITSPEILFPREFYYSNGLSRRVKRKRHNKGWNSEPGKSDIEIGH